MMMYINIRRSLGVRWFRLANRNRFAKFGRNVYVFEDVEFSMTKLIELGSDVVVQRHCYLAAASDTDGSRGSSLVIGDGSNIGVRNHVFAQGNVIIGKKVLTAPNVFISDCTHVFTDPVVPIMDQGIKLLAPTSIGDNSWIGHGSTIIGCKVGKHCVVGANSVVLSDVPDFSVVAGAPARIVKQFDPSRQVWIAVERPGDHSEPELP